MIGQAASSNDRGTMSPDETDREAALEAARIMCGAAHQSSVDGGPTYLFFLRAAKRLRAGEQ